MCGISGIIKFKNKINREEILLLNRSVDHRGPDDSGSYVQNGDQYGLALGHTRLSVIDLSQKGHQPMGLKLFAEKKSELIVEDERLHEADFVITYNGEIYNYREIRGILQSIGWEFESDSDTEVLLKSFVEWGEEALTKINGMWSFGVYNRKKDQLFLCRDRLGVKPLVYFFKESEFYFASEINAIKAIKNLEVDDSAVFDFFTYNYIPAPKTLFKNLKKLEAGHFLIFDCKKFNLSIVKYWDLNFTEERKIDYEKLNDLVVKSIKERLRSEVPLGVLLSGGLDSQSMAYFLKENKFDFKGFYLSFNRYDKETSIVRKTVNDFAYNVDFLIQDKELDSSYLDRIIKQYGEPFGDNSSIPTSQIIREVARKNIKVLLSGDGGDELFFGYKKYRYLYYLRIFNLLFPLSLRKILLGSIWHYLTEHEFFSAKFRKIFLVLSLDFREQFIVLSGGFAQVEKKYILPFEFLDKFKNYDPFWHFDKYYDKNISFAKSLQKLDMNSYLKNFILVKTDMMCMMHSIELRSPFLDYRLYEYLSGLKSGSIFRGLMLKRILRKLMKKRLPDYILHKSKTGFGFKNKLFPLDKNSYLSINKQYTKLSYEVYKTY